MTLPSFMRVVEMRDKGGPEVLYLSKRPVPQPSYGQILIKIAYAGVNRPDILQRRGLYMPPKGASDLLGLEASGTVVASGTGVSDWQIGDLVTALLPGGGYSEYALTDAGHALPVPKELSLDQASALPEACFTVWANVFERGKLRAGERILIHGGTSGIGTTAIQMASMFGARVFTTARTDEKCKICLSLGASCAINYRRDDFVEILRRAGGADVILDMVGGSYIARNLKALADEGRLVQIAFQEGAKAEINFAEIMMRRLSVTGSTLRPQSTATKAKIAQALRGMVWPHVSMGKLRPVIDSVYTLEDAAKAHEKIQTGTHIGKIILKVAET